MFWAIASGETATGASIHTMTRALDEGPIWVQVNVPLHRTDTYSAVYERLLSIVPELLQGFTRVLLDPEFKPILQDSSRATYFRNDRILHHRVLWARASADEIHNLVRACAGAAYCFVGHEQVHILEAEPLDASAKLTNGLVVPPGMIVRVSAQGPRLEVCSPPQTEVSWTSIATGADPGGHGIFDFVHRDPATYAPYVSILPTRKGTLGEPICAALYCQNVFRRGGFNGISCHCSVSGRPCSRPDLSFR